MELHLEGKKVIISGGAKGIGASIVKSFANEGAIPIILGRNPNEAKSLLEEIGIGYSFHLELTNLEEIQQTVKRISEEIGTIDILVNNAGVNDGVSLNDPPSKFIESLQNNLIHPFALAHYFIKDLKKNEGCIINISSKVADTGQGSTSGYAASKGGINALTREWAIDLASHGVRVNCVVPAEVITPLYEKWLSKKGDPEKAKAEIEGLIPLKNRFTTSEEIADTVVFLASPRSSHTTGQIIYPDGGYTHLDRAFKN